MLTHTKSRGTATGGTAAGGTAAHGAKEPDTSITARRRSIRNRLTTAATGVALTTVILGGTVLSSPTSAVALNHPLSAEGAHAQHATPQFQNHWGGGGWTPISQPITRQLKVYSADKRSWTSAEAVISRGLDSIYFELKILDLENYGLRWYTPIKFHPLVAMFTGHPMWSDNSTGVDLRLQSKIELFRNGGAYAVDTRWPVVEAAGNHITLKGSLPIGQLPGSYDVNFDAILTPNINNPSQTIGLNARVGTIVVQ